jgi:Holliday junction resolvase RusA-like endonuclease
LISFTIHGKPKALKRHRVSRNGGMYDPSSKEKKEIWLQIAKYRPKLPLAGDIYLKAQFYMPRPNNHYRTGKYAHLLKDSYKDVIYHSRKPDLDNLIKMVCDTIQGKERMIIDDSQICWLSAIKQYGTPRTEVAIEEIS